MSLLTSPHQPPPPPPASASPCAVPNGPQSPKQQKEPLSHRFNDFMTSKPKIHCFRSLKRGVSCALVISHSLSVLPLYYPCCTNSYKKKLKSFILVMLYQFYFIYVFFSLFVFLFACLFLSIMVTIVKGSSS